MGWETGAAAPLHSQQAYPTALGLPATRANYPILIPTGLPTPPSYKAHLLPTRYLPTYLLLPPPTATTYHRHPHTSTTYHTTTSQPSYPILGSPIPTNRPLRSCPIRYTCRRRGPLPADLPYTSQPTYPIRRPGHRHTNSPSAHRRPPQHTYPTPPDLPTV